MNTPTIQDLYDGLSRQSQTGGPLVTREEIEAKTRQGDHKRSERIKDHLCDASVGIIWVCAIMIAVGVLVYAYHMFAPEKYLFLQPKKVDEIWGVLKLVGMTGAGVFFGKKIT